MSGCLIKIKGLSLFLLAALLLAGVSFPLLNHKAYAQSEKKQRNYKTRRAPTINEQTYKRLADVQTLLDDKDLVGARAMLTKMLERGKAKNGYEKASIHNMLAYVSYSQEDYAGAIDHYKGVISDRLAIPEGLELGTLYTLSQLYFIEEEYPESLRYLNEWFGVSPNPGPNPYIFLTQVYYQMRNFGKAISAVKQAMDLANQQGLEIKENWWLLLRAMRFEREEYDKVIDILEILVRDFSKREYWVQLSGMYGQEELLKGQIQSIDAAYIGDLLEKEQEILNLVGLLLQNDAPYRAGVILEKAIADGVVEPTVKNMKMLAQAWQISQETDKAVPVLKSAAAKDDKGDLYIRLAQVYLEQEKYDGCIDATDQALRKGKLKRELLAHEVQGMCRFNRDLLKEASDSFRAAKQIAQDDRDLPAERRINRWIKYIEQEQRRLIALGLRQS